MEKLLLTQQKRPWPWGPGAQARVGGGLGGGGGGSGWNVALGDPPPLSPTIDQGGSVSLHGGGEVGDGFRVVRKWSQTITDQSSSESACNSVSCTSR